MSPAKGEKLIEVKGLEKHFKHVEVLRGINIDICKGDVVAVIGPSGSGKSTFLRCLNLLEEPTGGQIVFEGVDITSKETKIDQMRQKIGMVFQQPNPFHKTIYENIVFAPKRHGLRGKENLDALVEESLRGAALWDEVKDKLNQSAFSLSGGQQQRLCIARTLAMHPDVILFDEPCSALDPISTLAIEELMQSVVKERAIVIVTHNMEQASRVSNRTAFFYMGDMVECGQTDQIFQRPKDKRLNDYLTGMFS